MNGCSEGVVVGLAVGSVASWLEGPPVGWAEGPPVGWPEGVTRDGDSDGAGDGGVVDLKVWPEVGAPDSAADGVLVSAVDGAGDGGIGGLLDGAGDGGPDGASDGAVDGLLADTGNDVGTVEGNLVYRVGIWIWKPSWILLIFLLLSKFNEPSFNGDFEPRRLGRLAGGSMLLFKVKEFTFAELEEDCDPDAELIEAAATVRPKIWAMLVGMGNASRFSRFLFCILSEDRLGLFSTNCWACFNRYKFSALFNPFLFGLKSPKSCSPLCNLPSLTVIWPVTKFSNISTKNGSPILSVVLSLGCWILLVVNVIFLGAILNSVIKIFLMWSGRDPVLVVLVVL